MPKISKTLGIIPARYGSVRFPGKPLADIAGKSMIMRVYAQAAKARELDSVVVATDDERIYQHVEAFGGQVVMTSTAHATGTDRCAEVIELPGFGDFAGIVNIQGDEPFVQPSQIDLLARFLKEKTAISIVTLAKLIQQSEDLLNPNVVKVVFDSSFKALYFSRSPIPFLRNTPTEQWTKHSVFYKHIGMYGFRREVLSFIAKLPPSHLEQAESLEQLRWLEQGLGIGICLTEIETVSIDTPEDLNRISGRDNYA